MDAAVKAFLEGSLSMTTPSNATIMTTTTAKGIPAAGMDMSMGTTTIAAAIATADKRDAKKRREAAVFYAFRQMLFDSKIRRYADKIIK